MSALAFPKPAKTLPAERQRIRAVSRRDAAKDKATADRLCAALVKELAGYRCEASGFAGVTCSRTLDWAHMASRKVLSVRWAHSNTACLCRAHHDFFGRQRVMFEFWQRQTFGRVVAAPRFVEGVDIPAVVAGLRQGRFTQGER